MRAIKIPKKEKEGKGKRSVKERLLHNGKGNKLAGSTETENENYIKKFIMYSKCVEPIRQDKDRNKK